MATPSQMSTCHLSLAYLCCRGQQKGGTRHTHNNQNRTDHGHPLLAPSCSPDAPRGWGVPKPATAPSATDTCRAVPMQPVTLLCLGTRVCPPHHKLKHALSYHPCKHLRFAPASMAASCQRDLTPTACVTQHTPPSPSLITNPAIAYNHSTSALVSCLLLPSPPP